MRHFFLLVLSVFFPLFVSAQSHSLDSLFLALANATPATYPSVFSHIEQTLQKTEFNAALQATDKIISISQRLPFKGPGASAYRCKAIVYNQNNKGMQALQATQQAYRLAQKDKLPMEEAHSLKLMGSIYHSIGRQELALQQYLKALEIYYQQGYQKSEAETLYELGNLCYYTHKYNASKRYLLKAYQLGSDSLDKRILISCINTIALAYRAKEEYSDAIHYQKLSYQMAIQAKDSAWIAITAGNLGVIYQSQGNNEKALPYYLLDLNLSKKFNMWGSAANNYISIANVHLQKRNYSLAKIYLDSAIYLKSSVREHDFLQVLYQTLSSYYLQTNQLDKAYQYQKLQYTVKDSLDKRKYNAELEKVMAGYEWDKKQAEIALLKKDNEIIQAEAQQKNNTLFAITGILILIMMLAFILYRSNRQKYKANYTLTLQQKELSEKNEEIKQFNNSLEQKVEERTHQLQIAMENVVRKNQHLEDFAYVISHNLRAPIARIMGLVSIFNKDNLQDKSNLPILEHLNTAAVNLDMVVSDLNDILLMQTLADQYKEEVSLEDVTRLTIESLHEMIRTSAASIQTDYSQVDKLLTIKSYMTSILYNLVSNAIKYQSPERSPEILIKTSKVNDAVCLTVKDNGIGVDLTKSNGNKLFKLYQRMHTHVEGKGMGLFIVKEQVEALNGKIEVESAPNQGCAFHIYLPS
ncbi:sensor histidine kinase [Rhodocytophaga rosea]|uniref:histidine kinase n=1 Tax=Rhodocytophaga rosea TaxID=2704465 RepID=A0A6C0GRJ6_9BACT|nr:tetratricopeptide repeat-containing sensor histidine kinase [Rhodocytophaga rosea]QHT70725.1 sensor histidine kinase [Rhodocytophaga rosea]